MHLPWGNRSREKPDSPSEENISLDECVAIMLENENDGALIRRERMQNVSIKEKPMCLYTKPRVPFKAL